jgi:hypothetical protein
MEPWGHVTVPKLTCARRRESGPRGTRWSWSCRGPWWLELRGMWRFRNCPVSRDGCRRTRRHVGLSCLSCLTLNLYVGYSFFSASSAEPPLHPRIHHLNLFAELRRFANANLP